MSDLRAFPGGDLVQSGLADLRDGTVTPAALLVSIGAPRLRALGVEIADAHPEPEHRLYAELARDGEDSAHARYNAFLRRLVSFEQALACVGS